MADLYKKYVKNSDSKPDLKNKYVKNESNIQEELRNRILDWNKKSNTYITQARARYFGATGTMDSSDPKGLLRNYKVDMNSWEADKAPKTSPSYTGPQFSNSGKYEGGFKQDASEWYTKMHAEKSFLDSEAQAINDFIRDNDKYISGDVKTAWSKLYSASQENQNSALSTAKLESNLFGDYETEEDFIKGYEKFLYDDKVKTAHLQKEENILTVMNLDLDDYNRLRKKRDEARIKKDDAVYLRERFKKENYPDIMISGKTQEEINDIKRQIKEQRGQREADFKPYDDAVAKAEAEIADIQRQIEEFEKTRLHVYGGSYDGLLEALKSQEGLVKDIKNYQDLYELEHIYELEDYQKYSDIGKGMTDYSLSLWNEDELEGYSTTAARDFEDIYIYIREKGMPLQDEINDWLPFAPGITDHAQDIEDIALGMTQKEYDAYAYYAGKGDEEKKKLIIDTVRNRLIMEEAQEKYEFWGGDDASTLVQVANRFSSEFGSFFDNVKYNFTSYYPMESEARDVATAQVHSDLKDKDHGMLSSVVGGIGNQLPSIVASMIVTAATGNPTVGSLVGNVSMGVSASGSAYRQAIEMGYDEWDARSYGALVGGSELAIGSLLSGVASMGGSLTSKGISALTDSIDDVILKAGTSKIGRIAAQTAKIAVEHGGRMASEFGEEYLQAVLEPWYQNILLGTDNSINPFSKEVLEAGLVGALSAGVINASQSVATLGVNTGTKAINNYQTGKQLKADGIDVNQIADIGKKFSADTVAYKIANKVDENTGAYTIGKLFNEVNATMSEQNKAEIIDTLVNKGVLRADAEILVDSIETSMALGEDNFSANERYILDNNPALNEAVREVLVDKNTTLYQRISGTVELNKQLTEKALQKVANKFAKGESVSDEEVDSFAEETDLSVDAMNAENITASVDEASTESTPNSVKAESKTYNTVDNAEEAVSPVAKIVSTKDGKVKYQTKDGETVDASEAVFRNEDEAVIYETALDMGLPAAVINYAVNEYDSNTASALEYIYGVRTAYEYGASGIHQSYISSDALSALSHKQRQDAYELGKAIAQDEVATRQKAIKDKVSESKNAENKKGKVQMDGKEYNVDTVEGLTEVQKESVRASKILAEVLGNDINLYNSYVATEGKFKGRRVYKKANGEIALAPNGFYNPDGSINIDINAGSNGEGIILETLGHELTHHIRAWSPAKFKVMADFLFDQYYKHGVDVQGLIHEQIAKAKRNGRTISYDTAYEEVVADSFSRMLTDTDAISKLAKTDKGLYNKVKAWIKGIVNKINKLYSRYDPQSKEAQYAKKMNDVASELQRLWLEGLEDAGEAYSVVKEGKTFYKSKTSRLRYSFRDSESGMANDFLSPYNEELTHLINERGDYIVDSFEKLEHIVNIAFDNPEHKATAYFGVVNAEKINHIKNSINNMPKASKDILFKIGRDYSIATTLDSIRHIVDEKSLSRDDVVNYLDRFADTILEFDTVAYSTYVDSYGKKNVGLLFKKTFPDGMLVSFDLVSNKKRSIVLQTLYLNRADYQKKKSAETLLMPNASAHTPKARVGQTSKHSLPQQSENSQQKFSLRGDVEETKDLIAVHNLSEEKLLKTLELGGFPMPSIAVFKSKEGHTDFGDISVVFGKETIDPQLLRSNKVFSGDAYTPTYPHIDYKINKTVVEKGVDDVERLLKSKGFGKDDFGYLSSISEDNFKYGNTDEVANKTALKVAYLIDKGIDFKPVYKEEELSDFGRFDNFVVKHIAEALGKERIAELHNNSEGVKAAVEEIRNLANKYKANKYKDNAELFDKLSKNPFYGENNFDFSQAHEIVEGSYKYFNNGSRRKINEMETKKVIAGLINQTDYKKWVDNLFEGFIEKEGIRNNKDIFTSSGNRRSFEALHYEHNLENVVKAMKEEGIKGIGGFGGGNIFGASTIEYNSISDIKNSAQNRLQNLSDEEFAEIKKGFADRFYELASSLPNNKESFSATDDAANVLVEAISKYKTKSGIANYIRRECQGWATYSDHIVDDLLELVSDIRQMPTKYFEAKPQRAVGFDEVKAIIIPDNSSSKLKSALKSKSFDVLEYQYGNEQERIDVLNSLDEIKFSGRDSAGNTLSKEQQEFFKDSKVRDEKGNLLVVYHGTQKADFTVFKRTFNFYTDNKEMADSYANNSEMYTGYLNIANPYIIDAKGEKWSKISIDNETKDMLDRYGSSTFKEGGKWRTTPADIAYAILDGIDEGEFDYDGIIIKNVNDTGSYYKSNDNIIADDYITFNSNQFKNVDNKAPTSDADIRYSDRDTDGGFSQRSLLANALESTAESEQDKKTLAQYKKNIAMLSETQDRLHNVNIKIKELSFGKGKRDTKQLANLKRTAKELTDLINRYDKKLFSLESTDSLKRVLEVERKRAYKKATEEGRNNLQAYKDKMTQREQNIREKYQESRANAVEKRSKTEMKNKIKKLVGKLDSLLRNQTKEKHIPIYYQKSVAQMLEILNLDEQLRVARAEKRMTAAEEKYTRLLEEEKAKENPDAELIEFYQQKLDKNTNTVGKVSEAIQSIKDAYHEITSSNDPIYVNNPEVENLLDGYRQYIGDTQLSDMTLKQLDYVYNSFKIVDYMISEANKGHKLNRSKTISDYSEEFVGEIRESHKTKTRTLSSIKIGKSEIRVPHLLSNFKWDYKKPWFAIRSLGSKVANELYDNLRKGEDTWAVDTQNATKKFEELAEKYEIKKWKFDKKIKCGNVEITLDQLLSLYAYSKREAADKHLAEGGFVFDSSVKLKKGKKGIFEYQITMPEPQTVSKTDMIELMSNLTDDMKAWADEMQDYLSSDLSAIGNEVSRELYGINLFNEKHYFPIKAMQEVLDFNAEKHTDIVPNITNMGMTKPVLPNANNTIVLGGFTDIWARHCNDMAKYHAFALAMDDFTKVYNYGKGAQSFGKSVKVAIKNAKGLGDAANKYIQTFLQDVNGGVRADEMQGIDALISKFKKSSVMASASVIIQQPSAIGRAFGMINPKYFVKTDMNVNHAKTVAEMEKYAPIAIIKRLGGFDTNTSGKTSDIILGKDNEGVIKKANNALGYLPQKADELTWCAIWNACKREAKHKYNLEGEELLKKAGERFTEVIQVTQVYDSVFSRNAMMRSKSKFNKMVTAFMAEPITTMNDAVYAVQQIRQGNKKAGASMLLGGLTSLVINSLLSSIVYAWRDDDEDETFAEKYISSAVGETVEGLKLITYLPILKDIYSLAQGYDVERTDMALFSDVIDKVGNIITAYSNREDDMTDEELAEAQKEIEQALIDAGFEVLNIFGIPADNLRREIVGIAQTVTRDNDYETTWSTVMEAISEKIRDAKAFGRLTDDESKSDKIYQAIAEGDTEKLKRLKDSYKTEKAYESAMRQGLRDNDERIKAAAKAGYEGNERERVRICKEIIAEGLYSQDMVVKAVNAEINKLAKDEPEEEKEDTPEYESDVIYKASDINDAIEYGDIEGAYEIINELVEDKKNKYLFEAEQKGERLTEREAEKKAKSSLKATLTSHWKDIYIEAYKNGDDEECKRIRQILGNSNLWDRKSEVSELCRNWLKEARKK